MPAKDESSVFISACFFCLFFFVVGSFGWFFALLFCSLNIDAYRDGFLDAVLHSTLFTIILNLKQYKYYLPIDLYFFATFVSPRLYLLKSEYQTVNAFFGTTV